MHCMQIYQYMCVFSALYIDCISTLRLLLVSPVSIIIAASFLNAGCFNKILCECCDFYFPILCNPTIQESSESHADCVDWYIHVKEHPAWRVTATYLTVIQNCSRSAMHLGSQSSRIDRLAFDTTGRSHGKCKTSWWNSFNGVNSCVICALTQIGWRRWTHQRRTWRMWGIRLSAINTLKQTICVGSRSCPGIK